MITRIRPTVPADLPDVMSIYAIAREQMSRTGNATQWAGSYPAASFIAEEIVAGHSFVCVNEKNELVGTFCLVHGEDPTYAQIYEGQWLNDKPYVTLHCLRGKRKRPSQILHRLVFYPTCKHSRRYPPRQSGDAAYSSIDGIQLLRYYLRLQWLGTAGLSESIVKEEACHT